MLVPVFFFLNLFLDFGLFALSGSSFQLSVSLSLVRGGVHDQKQPPLTNRNSERHDRRYESTVCYRKPAT